MHFHSRTVIHTFHPMGGVFVIVLYITVSTNEIGRFLNYIQQRKSAAHGTLTLDDIVDHDDFLGPCMYFLVTSYTLTLYCMTARLLENPVVAEKPPR